MKSFYIKITSIIFFLLTGILAGAQTWEKISPFPTASQSQALYIFDENTLIAGLTDGSVLKTTDGGLTWSNYKTGFSGTIGKLSFVNSMVGYASIYNNYVIKTTDGGKTWSAANSGISHQVKTIHFVDANTGYAGCEDGYVYKTTNGGASWTQLNSGATSEIETIFFTSASTGYYIALGNVIKKTTNGGASWSSQTLPSSYNVFGSGALKFTDANNGIAGAAGGKIYKTTNGGTTWTNSSSGISDNLYGVYMIDASTIFMSSNRGKIIRTTNGGSNWSVVYDNSGEHALYDIVFANANTGYCMGANGFLLKTTDGGNSWTSLNKGLTNDIYSVHMIDENNFFAFGGGVMAKTTDKGESWTKFDLSGFADGGAYMYGSSFLDASHFIVVGDQSIRKTADGGSTWTETTNTNYNYAVSFPAASVAYVVGETSSFTGVMLKSTDGGDNWSEILSDYPTVLSGVYFTDENTGFICGGPDIWSTTSGKILKTTDGGNSWSEVYSASAVIRNIVFTDQNTGFAAGYNGLILKTTDAGDNWTSVNPDGTSSDYLAQIKFLNAQVGFAGDEWVGSFFKTTDGGETWTKQENLNTDAVNDFAFSGTKGIIGGSSFGSAGNVLYNESIPGVTVNTLPAVTTLPVGDITSTTATGNIRITAKGVPDPVQYGVCWNTTGSPDLSDSKAEEGSLSAIGDFTSSITGLLPDRTYYVRAYAVNDVGTAFGEEISFTTLKKELTVSGAQGENKVYDGSTDAVITGAVLEGVVGNDEVTLADAGTGTFSQADVATGVSITTSMSLSGADARHYTLKQPEGLTADITARELTVTGAQAGNKVYDGTTAAAIAGATLNGVITGDAVTLAHASAGTFAQNTVGTDLPVTTYMSLGGADAGNYILQQPEGLMADITAKKLSVTGAVVSSKVYDGMTDAAITGAKLDSVIAGDEVTLDQASAGTFAQSTVGTGIAVTTSMSLTGADAGNYSLQQPEGLSADIIAKELTVSGAQAGNKIYDGTNDAIITGATLDSVLTGDEVTLAQSAAGTFSQSTVGTGISVTTVMSLTGADAGNYSLQQPEGLMADITAKELTVTGAQAGNKIYDGTTDAVITGATLNGALTGDEVTLAQSAAGTFSQSTVGTGISVTTVMSLTGADAGNYSLQQPESLMADITAKELTVSGAQAGNKIYDGTTDAVITGATLTGALTGDEVNLSQSSAGTFAQSTVGTDITVSTAMSLTGADAGNYSLKQPQGLSADITPKELIVTADNQSREQCAANPDFSFTLSGFIASEDRSVLIAEPVTTCAANEASAAGDYDIVPSGGEAANYFFTYVKGTLQIMPDLMVPVLTSRDVTVNLDGSGKGSITATDVVVNAADNCGLADTLLSQDEFTRSDAGEAVITVTLIDVNGNEVNEEVTVTVNDPTGLSGTDIPDIKLYPNPTRGLVRIEFGEIPCRTMQIVDLTGKVLMIKSQPGSRESMDLSRFPSGVYLLKIATDKKIITRRVILQ